ncbi:hypothetical protein ACWDE9_25955 [Streptomyces olivaceoviridis]
MLIREAADPTLPRRQQGSMVRDLTAMVHTDPDGRPVRIIRWTRDRWISDWKRGGFDVLVLSPKQSRPRTPPESTELAASLKEENPSRSAAQICRIIHAKFRWTPDELTVQRVIVREGLDALRGPSIAAAFGRF